jgi:hypothetical protein
MEVGGQRHALTALPLGERLVTHFVGGWVGPGVGKDGCRQSRPQLNRPQTGQPVASCHTNCSPPPTPHTLTCGLYTYIYFFVIYLEGMKATLTADTVGNRLCAPLFKIPLTQIQSSGNLRAEALSLLAFAVNVF